MESKEDIMDRVAKYSIKENKSDHIKCIVLTEILGVLIDLRDLKYKELNKRK